jgi:hypothetical protein
MVTFHRSLHLILLLGALCCLPSQADVPANDQCETAIVLSSSSSNQVLFGTTLNSTKDTLNNCGENFVNSPGVWYVVQNYSESKVVTISTCSNATNFDTAISVYAGTSCESQNCLGGRNDDGECDVDTHSTFSWHTTAGENYYVLVHGNQEEDVGDFGLQVTVVEPLQGTNSNNGGTPSSANPFLSQSQFSIPVIGIGLLMLSLYLVDDL